MSDYTDALERIGKRVPMPEPALDRMVRRRERRHRNRRVTAGGFGSVITILLMLALVNVMPMNEREVRETPVPTTVDEVGPPDLLPPAGSEPTPGGAGRLLFWYMGGTARGMTQFMFLYADGRLLTNSGENDTAMDTRWVERRLTHDGVRRMLDAVAAANLPPAGALVAPGSKGWHQFSVDPGFDSVVRWGPRGWVSHADIVAEPAASAALDLLGERLTDPQGWLPSSDWERAEPLTFVPANYLVLMERIDEPAASWGWLSRESDVNDLPIPAHTRLPTVGGCVSVDLNTARSLVSLLDAEGSRFGGSRDQEPGVQMGWPAVAEGEPVLISIEFPLPHENCDVGLDR